MNSLKRLTRPLLILLLYFSLPSLVHAQKFIHPGVNQTAPDLAAMKKKVLAGEQPYKQAFDRLKAAADTNFVAKPHTHVLRGPYGRPNIGGDDLSRSADMAYTNALVWYITGDAAYAKKAIRIINAWSPVVWDFDYNDAKLLAAWTGHVWCNAAEILRYTNAGWLPAEIDRFTNMLETVYYPLIRFYFPQANGNWDGAIIHSIMAMAIFTDNRTMFNNAVDHFLHGPFNGSIFKYIYPSGQCQESLRDQGHVQLGLGEFAGAAQVAFTQGVDLFSIADNRIALGYEYTAGFLLGQKPPCYGVIAERAKNLRDDYEYVYQHYSARGVSMPFTKQAVDSSRAKADRSVLSSVRVPLVKGPVAQVQLKASTTGYVAGAGAPGAPPVPADAIIVKQGEPVQKALDAAAGTGRTVLLKAGLHTLPATLKMPSGVTLAGEGTASIIFLDPTSADRDAIVNAGDDLHDITIRDLLVEGSNKSDYGTDPNSNRSFRNGSNRGGIVFRALTAAQMKGIRLERLTVQNCTYNGVFISGASNVNILRCDFTENGSTAVPGPRLQHNLLLTHCLNTTIQDCRLDTSPFGAGIALDHCTGVTVASCEIARNAYHGALVTESNNITLTRNLIEGNNQSGILLEYLHTGSSHVTVTNNRIHYNSGSGVESYAVKNGVVAENFYAGNGMAAEKISGEKRMVGE